MNISSMKPYVFAGFMRRSKTPDENLRFFPEIADMPAEIEAFWGFFRQFFKFISQGFTMF